MELGEPAVEEHRLVPDDGQRHGAVELLVLEVGVALDERRSLPEWEGDGVQAGALEEDRTTGAAPRGGEHVDLSIVGVELDDRTGVAIAHGPERVGLPRAGA